MVPRQVGLRFSGTALTYALAAAGYLAVATVARGQAVARQEVTGGLAAGGRVVQTTSSHDATTTGLPAGARLVAGLDTSGGSARLVTSVVDPQAERVLIQLRGVPLARARALGQRASAPALAAQRQRASATIVQLAAQGRGRALTRAEVITREYQQVFHGFAARLPAGAAAQVRQLPDVEAVYPDLEAHASLSDSVPLIQAPAFWSAYGYRGAGTVIAIIDTGVDYTHADLGGCFGPSCKVIGGYDFANNDADPVDDNGHGTHVTSIAGGNGTLLGVAPDASILAYKVLNQYGSGFYSDIIAGIERAVDPNNDSDSSDHADVINMSLGGLKCVLRYFHQIPSFKKMHLMNSAIIFWAYAISLIFAMRYS